MNDTNIFVGRQPILDQNGDIYGYELLYRNSHKNFFPNVNPEQATISLLVNTFLTIGIDKVAGDNLSFINFTGELLAQDIFASLDPEKVVIEVLENVEITPSLLTKLRLLKGAGFKIALDDFILQEQYSVHSELFKVVDFVKVDYLDTTPVERVEIEKFIKQYPEIIMLAEKIETEEQFKVAKASGYKLFQGYFFSKPEIVSGNEIPSNVSLHFQIIERLHTEPPNIDAITELLMHDISLSYKLLRLINTLAFGVPKRISSIKQAIVLIGLRETKRWVQVLALREIGQGPGNGRTQALADYSLTRAKTCELLAKQDGKKNPEEYFFAGMFSLIDAIMMRDWDEILQLIPLSDEVALTVKGERTEITPYLQLAIAVERFDWQRIEQLITDMGITQAELSRCTVEAHRWTQSLQH
ncbi:HDOD domain-containing protein [Sporosarcina sp. E16_8]|uniref:EAL and HDOD domain-containing protein n=1 Tax=Sporosarcina sp. E16_8 TaxID=2789295 RepID=UPI001A929349|nr:HDOD domain-containing protein [Sporosarcina sp. E16_8]MBO0589085.1 HDOD domain-containing protein [Sporosarcina sp. E16_8]